jgi:hypothetical protein
MIIFVVVMINLLPLMIALLSFLSAPDNHIIWIRLFSGTVSLSLVIGAGLFLADIQQIWMEPSPSEIEARDRKQYEKLKARFDQQEDTTNGHF